MPHQQRVSASFVRGQKILHIHLLDLIGAVGIDLRRHAALREHEFLHRLAGDFHQAAADVE
jgi:hypothetical protein